MWLRTWRHRQVAPAPQASPRGPSPVQPPPQEPTQTASLGVSAVTHTRAHTPPDPKLMLCGWVGPKAVARGISPAPWYRAPAQQGLVATRVLPSRTPPPSHLAGALAWLPAW